MVSTRSKIISEKGPMVGERCQVDRRSSWTQYGSAKQRRQDCTQNHTKGKFPESNLSPAGNKGSHISNLDNYSASPQMCPA